MSRRYFTPLNDYFKKLIIGQAIFAPIATVAYYKLYVKELYTKKNPFEGMSEAVLEARITSMGGYKTILPNGEFNPVIIAKHERYEPENDDDDDDEEEEDED